MWLLDRMMRSVVRDGRLVITDHDGREYAYGSGPDAPVRIRFTDRSTAWRIMRDPRIGAGEAYTDGRLVVEPPHDIRDMILLIMRQNEIRAVDPPSPLRRALDRVASRLDPMNHRARARANVEHHYDLTRRFY